VCDKASSWCQEWKRVFAFWLCTLVCLNNLQQVWQLCADLYALYHAVQSS